MQFVLIMNKCDMERSIDPSLVEQFIQSEPHIASYFTISCKTGEGLDEIQSWLIERAS